MFGLDQYDLKARVVPGILLSLPVIAVAYDAAPALKSWPIFATSGVCVLALIYGLGQFARSRGEAIESELWSSWDGPPSTRFLRHRNAEFGPELRGLLHRAVERQFTLRLLTAEEEAADPMKTDQAIYDAFRNVRAYLREKDPKGLWFTHNIEYGFWRNLLGCRVVWTTLAAIAAISSAIIGAERGTGYVNIGSGLAAFFFICALYVGWMVAPKQVERVANGYAEQAWVSFLRLSTKPEKYAQTGTAECNTGKKKMAKLVHARVEAEGE